jgi:hypothetical protein
MILKIDPLLKEHRPSSDDVNRERRLLDVQSDRRKELSVPSRRPAADRDNF